MIIAIRPQFKLVCLIVSLIACDAITDPKKKLDDDAKPRSVFTLAGKWQGTFTELNGADETRLRDKKATLELTLPSKEQEVGTFKFKISDLEVLVEGELTKSQLNSYIIEIKKSNLTSFGNEGSYKTLSYKRIGNFTIFSTASFILTAKKPGSKSQKPRQRSVTQGLLGKWLCSEDIFNNDWEITNTDTDFFATIIKSGFKPVIIKGSRVETSLNKYKVIITESNNKNYINSQLSLEQLSLTSLSITRNIGSTDDVSTFNCVK